jgi:hypothetical protein
VFDVAVGTSCILIVGAVFMEWKSVKKDKAKFQKQSQEQEQVQTKSTEESE